MAFRWWTDGGLILYAACVKACACTCVRYGMVLVSYAKDQLSNFFKLYKFKYSMATNILGNPGVTHSVPTAFIIDECSGYGMGHAWVTEDGLQNDSNFTFN